jgi:N-acetylglutamate synthase-like GNAT family acetyltransferase
MAEGIEIRRAGSGDLAAIAALVDEATQSRFPVDEAEVMEWLFSKGLIVAVRDDSLVGVAAWQAENLVSVTDVFCISPSRLQHQVGTKLLASIEAEANTLMCEANIMLLPAWTLQAVRTLVQQQGYEPQEFEELHRIWREVLVEFVTADVVLMVKRLRDRMVMVPI